MSQAKQANIAVAKNGKKLHQLEEIPVRRSGIDVVCRIRPKLPGELYVHYQLQPDYFNNEIEIFEPKQPQNSKKFRFTKVLDQSSTQNEIAQQYVSKLIQDLFEQKKSALVFSYGVTNSGKTYTIVGTPEYPGLLPQTLQCLLKIKHAIQKGVTNHKINDRTIQLDTVQDFKLVDVDLSFESYEIYNEEIFDLLRPGKDRFKLQLKENAEKRVTVKDACQQNISTQQDVDEALQQCLSNRQMGETILNISSSRSHTIFKIYLKFIYKSLTSQNEYFTQSSLCVVDLAGSERAKKAETQGSQLNEACNINKSLLVLGRCLTLLRSQEAEPNQVIPFRECKLTRILCEYFFEDNNILMIVNIKLTVDDLEETSKVLHYGAMGIKINLLKSKVLESTVSFQQRMPLRQDQLKEINEMAEESDISENGFEKQHFIKTISVIENIKFICTNNQQLMQCEYEDQLRRIMAFNNRLQEVKIKQKSFDEDFQQPFLVSGAKLEKKLSSLQQDTAGKLSERLSNLQLNEIQEIENPDTANIDALGGQFEEELVVDNEEIPPARFSNPYEMKSQNSKIFDFRQSSQTLMENQFQREEQSIIDKENINQNIQGSYCHEKQVRFQDSIGENSFSFGATKQVDITKPMKFTNTPYDTGRINSIFKSILSIQEKSNREREEFMKKALASVKKDDPLSLNSSLVQAVQKEQSFFDKSPPVRKPKAKAKQKPRKKKN